MKIIYWFTSFLSYSLFKIFYRMEIVGNKNIPDRSAIIAPNHISYLDPAIIGATSPREVHFLANVRLFNNRLFGWYITQLNSHPVNPAANDTQAVKKILHLLGEGKRVMVFPEGTRSVDGKLQPLKLGCAMLSIHSQSPIIPALIEGAYEIWPKNQKRPNLTGKIKITYGSPIYPDQIQASSKKEAQILLTKEIENALINMKGKDINLN